MSAGSWMPTPYGFEWKPADADTIVSVSRVASINGRGILAIETRSDLNHQGFENLGLEVYVSKGGRSIRVWDRRTGKELTCQQ